jgi:hypothetical protein
MGGSKSMDKRATIAQVLEAADELTLDEQLFLADILRKRVIEGRRAELAGEVREALEEYWRGECRPAAVEDLMSEIRG